MENEYWTDIIAKSISKYRLKVSEGRIPIRLLIPNNICEIVGLRDCFYENYGRGRTAIWKDVSSFSDTFPKKTIDTFIQNYNKTFE